MTATEVLQPALIFDAMAEEYRELIDFDWDGQWEIANEPVDPWEWGDRSWKSQLRMQLESITGSPDVTGWTQEHATFLSSLLETGTDLPPTVTEVVAVTSVSDDAPLQVSAESTE